jgi:hypothetical protein
MSDFKSNEAHLLMRISATKFCWNAIINSSGSLKLCVIAIEIVYVRLYKNEQVSNKIDFLTLNITYWLELLLVRYWSITRIFCKHFT